MNEEEREKTVKAEKGGERECGRVRERERRQMEQRDSFDSLKVPLERNRKEGKQEGGEGKREKKEHETESKTSL